MRLGFKPFNINYNGPSVLQKLGHLKIHVNFGLGTGPL
jgi:hypothetical protein